MESRLTRTLSFACLAVMAGGCGSPDLVMAPGRPVDDPLPVGAYPQIVLTDHLEQALVGAGVAVDPAHGNDMMRVRATLRSVVDADVSVQYRFTFTNKDGTPASDNDDAFWQSATFAPRTQRTLTGQATTYAATGWRIEVRAYR